MKTVVVLVLVVYVAGVATRVAATEAAPRAISVFDDNVDKKPKAPTSCGDNKEKHDCLHIGAQEGDCAWCEGDYMPASCLSTMAAKYIPEMVAHCKMPKKLEEVAAGAAGADASKKPKAPTSCGDNKEKHDCLDIGAQEGDCAWCQGEYMPAKCMSIFAAQYIPETVAQCKTPAKLQQVDAADASKKPKAPTSCGDNKEKHDCLHIGAQEGDCAWCEGDYMPASCLSTMAAKYIPEMVAHCKMPKKLEEVEVSDTTVEELEKPSGGSSGSGGDWPSGGGDWPAGGGSGAGGCKDKTSKKKCLRDASCAWCKKSFMGEGCTDASSVKYLPKSIADCKLPDRKGLESVETS